MKKVWTIAWNDTTIRFRDRNAILLMLVAPLVLSFIIGTAFGGFIFGGETAPLRDIPLIVVNDDVVQGEAGALSQQFIDVLVSDDLADLLAPTFMDDLAEARAVIERGETRAVIHIPAGFTERLNQSFLGPNSDAGTVTIDLYTDPAASITPNIIRNIADQIAVGFSSAAISSRVAQEMLLANLTGPPPADIGETLQAEISGEFADGNPAGVGVTIITPDEEESDAVNPLGYFAPSMAIFFLMFTVFDGTRAILDEEREGTLPRLMSTPTSTSQILLGKIGGTFLTGLLQFAIFVVVTRLLFSLEWGSPLGLLLMALAVVAAATSLGALVASITRDIRQASIVGSVIVLVSGLVGGAFFVPSGFPDWLQVISRLSINRWGLDGFVDLALRGLGVRAILPEAGVLLGFAAVLFAISLARFQRRFAR